MTQSTLTTCPYCGVGCGVKVTPLNDKPVFNIQVEGDEAHPANLGRLCSKGSALGETIGMEGRLLQPKVNGDVVPWDDALNHVADKFQSIIKEHGPDSVAFYVSGQLLTEDYYVANKLMKGFIGSGNIDTNSRLCMSSAVIGYKRAFGADTVPCSYEDLESCDLLIITGSNMAWTHPVLFQRVRQAKLDRPQMKVIVIDPRRTSSCDIADLHLPLASGSDAYLFNGLLEFIKNQGALDQDYINRFTENFDAVETHGLTVETVAQECQLNTGDVETFYQWFVDTERSITFYCMGINQSATGSDKANAIINSYLATGRLGKEGMGPFSITGQPNAMGGREVGGLANQLAAHMDFANKEQLALVEEFWSAENMATEGGLKAVELFDAIEAGKVKAVWIMATNPIVSLPDADRMRKILQDCECVVVSDCIEHTDTAACADVLLPATTWGEKDGTVTNSERRISRQRAFREAPGESKNDWWIMCEVAKRMGYTEGFNYQNNAEIFREHAQLSAYKNEGQRDFDLSGMTDISKQDYDALIPIQWPVKKAGEGTARMFTEQQFFTPSGKAQFISVVPQKPVNTPNKTYPLVLNTGRVRDHWHTMTRTGTAARLSKHIIEPFVQIHPDDAKQFKVENNQLALVKTHWGEMLARANITDEQNSGNIFVPMHWNDQFAYKGRADALVNPVVDPLSGQPEYKHTPATIKPWQPEWYGFVLLSDNESVTLKHDSYWAKANGEQFIRYELAGEQSIKEWPHFLNERLSFTQGDKEKIETLIYQDEKAGRYRAAYIYEDQLLACVFVASNIDLPSRNWLASLFAEKTLNAKDRKALLAGRDSGNSFDPGETICSCFAVGENVIRKAIKEKQLCTPKAIGECLKAGTNCGSCVPELKKLIALETK